MVDNKVDSVLYEIIKPVSIVTIMTTALSVEKIGDWALMVQNMLANVAR